MGSQYQNRLSDLRKQFDESRIGSIGLLQAFFVSFLVLFILSFFLPYSPQSTLSKSSVRPLNWMQDTEKRVSERSEWLENSIFGHYVADWYWSFSKGVVEVFIDPTHYQETAETKSVIDIGGWFQSFKELYFFLNRSELVFF